MSLHNQIKRRIAWAKVDWTQPDAEIARRYKTYRELVRQWRRRLKKPKSPRHNRQLLRPCHVYRSQILRMLKRKYSQQQIADMLGVTRSLVRRVACTPAQAAAGPTAGAGRARRVT